MNATKHLVHVAKRVNCSETLRPQDLRQSIYPPCYVTAQRHHSVYRRSMNHIKVPSLCLHPGGEGGPVEPLGAPPGA